MGRTGDHTSGVGDGWKAAAPNTFAAMTTGMEALLLLGGDLGDVRATLDRAIGALRKEAGTVLAVSRDHWTEPWGFAGQGLFLNRAVVLRTTLSPEGLMRTLLAIEGTLGRTRTAGQGPASRPVDIDILLMGDTVMDTPGLVLPHPRMHLRRFALAPAADVAPSAVHPVSRRTVLGLLGDLVRTTP